MGGHGGLNILPQKRWNVYNQDNREKVEKDVRRDEERKAQEEERKAHDQAEMRYNALRAQKFLKRQENNDESKPKSAISDEIRALYPEKFNLFEQEEKEYVKNRRHEKNEDNERERKAKEDRFVEQTTCYLGQTVKKSTPWYCQTTTSDVVQENANNERDSRRGRGRGRGRDRRDNRQFQETKLESVFKVPEDSYFKVLDLDTMKDVKKADSGNTKDGQKDHSEIVGIADNKDGGIKEHKREKDLVNKTEDRSSRDRTREKEKKKKDKKDKKEKKDKDKKHKKHKKKHDKHKTDSRENSRSRSRSKSTDLVRNKNKEEEEKREKEEKLRKLRDERLKREQAERRKAQKLIRENPQI